MKSVHARARLVALVLLAAALGACGAEPGGDGTTSTYSPDVPLAGVYALDFRRTSGGVTKDADGNEIPLSEEAIAKIQKNHGAGSLRLELRVDGTFELITEMGEDDLRSGGTWKETGAGVELATTTLDGEPVPAEMAGHVDRYLVETGYLVLEVDGQRTYLKRQPDQE